MVWICVYIKKQGGEAVGGNGRNAGVLSVRGPGGHGSDERNSRPDGTQDYFHGLRHLREKRRGRHRHDRHHLSVRSELLNDTNLDLLILVHALESLVDFLRIFARKNPAIDIGASGFWERVRRIPSSEHGGNARRLPERIVL